MPRNHWLDTADELATAASRAQAAGTITAPKPKPATDPDPWDRERRHSLAAASAAHVIGDPPTGRLIRPHNDGDWAKECWQFYDAVGELHYVATQNGRAIGRVRFYIAEYGDDNVAREVEKGNPAALSKGLLGGEAQSADLKFSIGVQGIISGQTLLTIHDKEGWAVYSDQDFVLDQTELRAAQSKRGVSPYRIISPNGQDRLPDKTLTIHMWDRHPGHMHQADSSTRPARPYLRELCRIDEYVQATLLSRIATAGILQVPMGAQIPPPPNLPPDSKVHPLSHYLGWLASQNISQPGSASGVTPLVIDMPDGKELKHITIDYPLTEVVNQFREMNLKRIAMSMDMAPETMSGFSDVKYSNAEFIQDENTRTHIMRRVNAVRAALTQHYVVPLLGEQYIVEADLSDLEVRPDKSESAIALFDRGEIDGDTLREETGLRDGKAPEGDELLKWLAVRAATTNPSLLPALLPLLGVRQQINIQSPPEQRQLEQGDPESDANSTEPQPADAPSLRTPSGPDARGMTNVRGPQPLLSALVAACDVMVSGALTRIGSQWRKRKRSRVNASRDVEPLALYLAPCFNLDADLDPDESRREHVASMAGGFPGVPRVAAMYGADPDCVTASLTDYVTGLVCERRPHSPEAVAEALAGCVGAAA